jgi:signal transduction histidine kinase
VPDVKGWLRNNLDVVAFAAALIVAGALMSWWAVLTRHNIIEMHGLVEAQLVSTISDSGALAEQLAALRHHTDRQLFMIAGESGLAAILLVTFACVLFMVARRRRAAADRMQRLLQFTTHELKTPIAGVRALLQSLELESVPAEHRRRLLAQGVIECNRLEHLAETILTYQRAVARPELSLVVHSADELIEHILEHRRATLGVESVEWRPGPAARVSVDADAFRVVLENLLDNAKKYGGDDVTLSSSIVDGGWQLAVHDRGIGFDPAEAEQLFDPFSRHLKAGMTAHGSGLGLYLSRQLARDMRGSLSATSEGPGHGSTFLFTVPLAAGEAQPAKESLARA